MSPTTTLAVAALIAAEIALPAFAQSTPTVSRADVKAETRAAERVGKLVPAGEGAEPIVPTTSQKTREQRKAETLAARRDGLLIPGDLAVQDRVDRAYRAQATAVSREARKSETRAAEKARTLTPAGEGPEAPRK